MLWEALFLQLGYNATLVTIGACFLGIAAGVTGTFLFLRKRALVSDAISHATLPGVALAFTIPLRVSPELGTPPLKLLEKDLHGLVVYAVLPVFAFANPDTDGVAIFAK